jgi:hypothetical protein
MQTRLTARIRNTKRFMVASMTGRFGPMLQSPFAAGKAESTSPEAGVVAETSREVSGLPAIPTKTEGGQGEEREIFELERELKEVRRCIKELKQREMARVSREYIENAYEQQHGVEQKIVIAALIGEEGARFELERQLQEKQQYRRHQANRSTFHFGRPLLFPNPLTRKLARSFIPNPA